MPLNDLQKAVGMDTPYAAAPATEKGWWAKWWGILILVVTTGVLGAIAIFLIWRSSLPKWLKWILTVLSVGVSWALQILLTGEQQ